MSDLELCYLPATEAIERFKAKTLSPVELLEAMIKRSEEVDPVINAFTYRHFDEAMANAKKAEAKYASGKRTRALEGLPIGIKDENFIKGKPTSSGSLIMKDFVADTTSVGNERILRAGGIVHARTATPEFSSAGYTHSRLWGVTRNPWNPEFTPGGSSGGSAASLAAGIASVCWMPAMTKPSGSRLCASSARRSSRHAQDSTWRASRQLSRWGGHYWGVGSART